jgi:transcriptional regulator with XRE-family HTH domain
MKSNKISRISFNIKKYRNKLGISQDRLSKLSDVTYNTIIKLESGANTNPTIETLMKVAKALNTGVDDLIKK